MERRILMLIFFMSISSIYSQYSDSFKAIIHSIEPIDSSFYEIKYKDGSYKEKGKIYEYKIAEKSYFYFTDKFYRYYKDGQIMNEMIFGKHGDLLFSKVYDENGNLIFESETISLDTNSKNIEDFFFSEKELHFERIEKEYKYSKKLSKYYLYKEWINFKGKIKGNYKIFNTDGSIKKIKNY